MLGGIFVVFISGLISFLLIEKMKKKYASIDVLLLKRLFFYHLLLSLAYYGYALFNPSDSYAYYNKVLLGYRGTTWGSYYGTSTTFIEFIGYPFIRYFFFSYEAVMALFSFIGFLGFIYFYIFFKENLRFRHSFMRMDLLTLIFFLPNLHFWSASFGKGSLIFFGLGLFFFGISRLSQRFLAVIIGGFIIYHVRPHVMLVILISSCIGFMFTTKGVSVYLRIIFLIGVAIAFYYIYGDVLTLIGIEEGELVSEGLDLSHRAAELTKATSGVDITSYNLPFQIFTFLYRPLFLDAPGILGIIVSFENVIYLLLTLKLFNLKCIRFLPTSNFLVKTALLSFLTVTIALAQIAGNLGLAMRQKSQVMILLLFVIITFLDAQMMHRYRAFMARRTKHLRILQSPPVRG